LVTSSLNSMLTLITEYGIVGLGVTLLMIGGEFNLSVGSVWGLSAALAILMVNAGVPAWISVIVVLIAGTVIGLLQGLVVVKMGIPSFIVTLVGMMFCRGLVLVSTQASVVTMVDGSNFFRIFSYTFGDEISVSTFWFIGTAVILGLILHRTQFGNWIFATGGNKVAARKSGVPVDRVKLTLFGLSSGLASLGGIVQLSRFGSVDALRGETIEFYVIAMAVIGGCRLLGGYGSILGTVLGAIMLAMIRNGLVLAEVPSYWFNAFLGFTILVAVIINTTARRRAIGE